MNVRVKINKTKTVETEYLILDVDTLDEAGELALSCAQGYPQDGVKKVSQTTPTPTVYDISTYEVVSY